MTSPPEDVVEAAVTEAYAAPLEGWDFSWLERRSRNTPPPWNYSALARAALRDAKRALDIDTGGGEILAKLAPFDGFVVATEGFGPNVPTAARRLAAVGVPVVHGESAPDNVDQTQQPRIFPVPFRSEAFDVVLNRHSSYWPSEVARVLRPGGRFLTQQRSDDSDAGANWARLFDRPDTERPFDVDFALGQLRDAGFDVVGADVATTPISFFDLAAVVYYLRMIPWAVDEFDPMKDHAHLVRIAEHIEANGELAVGGSTMLVEAVRS